MDHWFGAVDVEKLQDTMHQEQGWRTTICCGCPWCTRIQQSWTIACFVVLANGTICKICKIIDTKWIWYILLFILWCTYINSNINIYIYRSLNDAHRRYKRWLPATPRSDWSQAWAPQILARNKEEHVILWQYVDVFCIAAIIITLVEWHNCCSLSSWWFLSLIIILVIVSILITMTIIVLILSIIEMYSAKHKVTVMNELNIFIDHIVAYMLHFFIHP